MMAADFRFLLISAMYENGGNTTHRFLDGHPQMFVYPFESQLGTKLVVDELSSMFPVKYRWPEFALSASPESDYMSIIDEECRVRARTPFVSKFRDSPFEFSDEHRLALYLERVQARGRSRGGNVASFFEATFQAWRDYRRSGREVLYVGYSPIVVVDAAKILADLPGAHILHVVRNPWSAYADTKKRPVPLSLAHYMRGWTINQQAALQNREQCPDRVHVVRIEDVMRDSRALLGEICKKLGLESAESLGRPSWNGTELQTIYPWGTIRKPTLEANKATAEELSSAESGLIREAAGHYLDVFDYRSFI